MEINKNAVVVDSGEAKFVMNFLQRIHAAINMDMNDPEARMTESELKGMREYRYHLHQVLKMMRGNRGRYKDIKPEELEEYLLLSMGDTETMVVNSKAETLDHDINELVDLGFVVAAYRIIPETGNKVSVYDGI